MEKGAVRKLWSAFKELPFCQSLLAVIFLSSVLIITFLQGVLYVSIRPFHPTLYRRANYYLTYAFNSQIVFLVEWWSESRVQLYTDVKSGMMKHFGQEHALLLANHTYEIDWVMGWLFCDRVGVLGNAKAYVKKIISYIPLPGWSWKFQEMIFLERDWEKDKKVLGVQLNNLAKYPDPMWLALFPEGTRFTPEKHKASMEVARSKGLPVLKHHLLPRTKGFVASLPYLRGKVPAIYDWVVVFDAKSRNEPSFRSIIKGRAVCCKIMVRRIPLEDVPQDENKAADWLHKLYQEKDKLLDNFLRTGQFLSNSDRRPEFQNYDYVELPRRNYSLLNVCFWAGITLVPLAKYFINVLCSGNYLNMGIVLAFVVAVNLGLTKLINLTRISKGSSYGQRERED